MNTRETQQALKDLGFVLAVDGSYGPDTKQEVEAFQEGFSFYDLAIDGQAGPKTHTALRYSLERAGRCGNYFTFREFASKGNGDIRVARELVRGLDVLRTQYGPVTVVSGYRDIVHNRKVGGAQNSQHLYGNAADIRRAGATLNGVRNLHRFSGIGIQRSTGLVIHVDVRHVGPNTTGGSPSNPTVWYYG